MEDDLVGERVIAGSDGCLVEVGMEKSCLVGT